MMKPDDPIVFVVDDDHRMQEALSSLVEAMGFRVATFGSASEFLEAEKPDSPACLLLDLETRQSASRLRKAASPASEIWTHFRSGDASAS
jgi:FixJ family two-component response regulator